ncbi:uncharacterized protein LOC102358318 [Latimeria chalumnae]|uniref:uncharacterized protein LOC102358318 n=1 Tax=Latimeria chalumnae TaxID=7897 RepID=UPI0003C1183C|nr:PREDICTED: aurora kinase A and ninein-interacting protein [Latimeria chalumnae]|eukprot:XP_005993989.1 PREDICTED: aurora kinase A and ninein-interacting protein [Latimeria chalumnae]
MKQKGKSGSQEPEECGVWLDTRELKKKKTQHCLPVSKLKFLTGSRCNNGVMLNFTQTTAPQTCTKQTTISSFFTANPHDLLQNSEALQLSNASLPSAKTGTREKCTDWQESVNMKRPANEFKRSDVVTDQRKDCYQKERSKPDESHHHLNLSDESNLLLNFEMEDTEIKSKFTEPTKFSPKKYRSCEENGRIFSNISQLELQIRTRPTPMTIRNLGCVDKENCFTQPDFTQDSQGNKVIAHRKLNKSPRKKQVGNWKDIEVRELSYWAGEELGSMHTEKLGKNTLMLGKEIAMQRCLGVEQQLQEKKFLQFRPTLKDPLSLKDSVMNGKENRSFPLSSLQNQTDDGKVADLTIRPQCNSLFWPVTYTTDSIVETPLIGKEAQNGLSTQSLLFTQDTQGNAVIAHRNLDRETRIPGRKNALENITNQIQTDGDATDDCSRLSYLVTPCMESSSLSVECKEMEVYSQADFLFTQDSEGNYVIKHE